MIKIVIFSKTDSCFQTLYRVIREKRPGSIPRCNVFFLRIVFRPIGNFRHASHSMASHDNEKRSVVVLQPWKNFNRKLTAVED